MNIEQMEQEYAEICLFGENQSNIEDTEVSKQIKEKYGFINTTLDEYCGLFYKKRDYSGQIKRAASNIKLKMERDEIIFCEIKLLINFVKRVPEIADYIAEQSQSSFRYAAASEYIQFAKMEKIEIGEYYALLRIANDEMIITLKNGLEKLCRKVGFVVKIKSKEKKFSYAIDNGELRLRLRKKEETIKSEDIKFFFTAE